jgi:hypothetical protein
MPAGLRTCPSASAAHDCGETIGNFDETVAAASQAWFFRIGINTVKKRGSVSGATWRRYWSQR